MTRLLLVAVIAACGNSSSSSSSSSGLPAPLAQYKEGYEVTRFTGFAIDGVELWQATVVGVSDLSSSSVVGIENGKLVAGKALFLRNVELPPAELAARALALLMGAAGGQAMMPGEQSSMATAEELALVKPPEVGDGRLRFWQMRGEMAPQLQRISVDLKTAEVSSEPAANILHPPPDPLPPIRALLASGDKDQVAEGLKQVSEYKALAADVARLLAHPDSHIRMMAMGVLGNLEVPSTVPPLVELMNSAPEWGDRSLAAQSLLAIGSAEAVAAVRAYAPKATGFEATPIREALERFDREQR